MGRIRIFFIVVVLIGGLVGCDGGGGGGVDRCPTPPPSQNLEIQTWYDLDAVRDNLAGNHTLMNDLDSNTPGYDELASPAANGGKGWEPIGTFIPDCSYGGLKGTFDGQGYEIHDLFIDRPDEGLVGLFGCLHSEGVIKDIGVTNITVIGNWGTGGLVGRNILGAISNSYAVGNVSGDYVVGGLVGYNQDSVSNCYATGNVVGGGVVGDVGAVMGGFSIGGLIGLSETGGTVSSCYFTGNVTSYLSCVDEWVTSTGVGGLVGLTCGTVSSSYSDANVTGKDNVGGLVGNNNWGTLSGSYSAGSVTGDSSVGGLVGYNGYGTVSNSFWDIQTSGQSTSDGGTGKTTAQMQNITTFSGAAWNIIEVGGPSQRNPVYIWNIVNNVTYPFLGWQS